MAFLGNQLIDDDFWHARTWTIALNRFKSLLDHEDMTIRLRPLQAGHPCLKSMPVSMRPDFSSSHQICEVRQIQVVPEYQAEIKW